MNSKSVQSTLPTRYGEFVIHVWPEAKGSEPIALTTKTIDNLKPVLVRVHSECITGDVFYSQRCDCAEQKDQALKMIAESNNGIFIYLRQEGRGIGLYDKIKTYKLQEEGKDTYDANILIGHKPDEREYSWANRILSDLGVNSIKLITNNLEKLNEIQSRGVQVLERIPLITQETEYNHAYLQTKREKFHHLL